MRTRVLKVPKTLKVLECLDRMDRWEVNSVIVLNEDDTYAGTVQLEAIQEHGKVGHEIGELVSQDTTVSRQCKAQEALDQLLDSPYKYLVVLNDDRTVASAL